MKIKYRYQLTRILLLLLLCSGIAFGLFNYKQKTQIQASGNKIKIGVIAALSGSNKLMGLKGLKGIEIIQQLNPLLNNGDLIELIIIDTQDNEEKSIKALKIMSEVHKVSAILLLSNSNTVLTVAEIADQYQIPILAVNASHPNITKMNSWVNQFNFDDEFQASAAALFIRDELFLEKVAIFTHSDNVHFSFLATEFARQYSEVGGVITDTIDLKNNEDEIGTVLQSIKIKEPELLYLQVPTEELIEIVIALKKLDWKPKIMLSDGLFAGVLSQDKFPVDLFDDILATETFHNEMQLTKFGKHLKTRLKSINIAKNQLVTHTLLGIEAYAFLLQAMNRCNDLKNNVCINNKIRSTRKFEGIMGYISIDHMGKAHRSLVINNIKAGKMNFIVKVY